MSVDRQPEKLPVEQVAGHVQVNEILIEALTRKFPRALQTIESPNGWRLAYAPSSVYTDGITILTPEGMATILPESDGDKKELGKMLTEPEERLALLRLPEIIIRLQDGAFFSGQDSLHGSNRTAAITVMLDSWEGMSDELIKQLEKLNTLSS